MIRERVQNHGVIPRHCMITEYETFIIMNKYDASDVYLYQKACKNSKHAYYIRYTNDNKVTVQLFSPTETFSIFNADYNAYIADNVTIDCDIAYDKKPYTN